MNLNKIEELAEGDKSFLKDLIETFNMAFPMDFESLADACDLKDKRRVSELCHKMKASSELFQMNDFTEHLAKLNQLSKTDFDNLFIKDLLESMKIELNQHLKELDEYYKTL